MMLCPGCGIGTMSETRPYVWSCNICGHKEFKPNESSSYASEYDTSSYSTSSYNIDSSYTSSYDTSTYDTCSSYGTQDYGYSGSGSSNSSKSKKLNIVDILCILMSVIVAERQGFLAMLVYWACMFFWRIIGGFFGKCMAVIVLIIWFF